MQNSIVELECKMSDSFRAQKAANSCAMDSTKKSKHRLEIKHDALEDFNVGLIIGSSGSGKTTLARQMFGSDFDEIVLDKDKSVIDSFHDSITYEQCVENLTGMGLSSIPCWLRPMRTLSNGQMARATAALAMADETRKLTVLDEWTSVVDRTVGKIMSHRIQKEARRKKKKVVLLSCHYDVIEWLNPDFIIDCNLQEFKNRKKLGEVETHKRQDRLRLDIKECNKNSWQYFSKYHYLSSILAPDTRHTFGLYNGEDQIGFVAFTRYAFKNMKMLHSNRVVIHPDYIGLGLGIKFVEACAQRVVEMGYEVRCKFTSVAMLKARQKNPRWSFLGKQKLKTAMADKVWQGMKGETAASTDSRNSGKLSYVIYYRFKYVPIKARGLNV